MAKDKKNVEKSDKDKEELEKKILKDIHEEQMRIHPEIYDKKNGEL